MEQPDYGPGSLQNEGVLALTDPLGKFLYSLKTRFIAAYQAAKETDTDLSMADILRARSFAIYTGLLALAGALFLEFCMPAHAGMSLLYSSLAIAPFFGFTLYRSHRFARKQIKTLVGFKSATILGQGLWGLSLFLAFAGLFWALNMGLDKASSPQTFTVIDRHTVYDSNTPADYVSIILRGSREEIRVTPAEYAEAVPGHSQLELMLHKGFFGLPWYGSRYSFTSKRTSSGFVLPTDTQTYDYKGISHYAAAP